MVYSQETPRTPVRGRGVIFIAPAPRQAVSEPRTAQCAGGGVGPPGISTCQCHESEPLSIPGSGQGARTSSVMSFHRS